MDARPDKLTLHASVTPFEQPPVPPLYRTGVDHLLAGEKPPSEAQMACYMALLMQLAVKPEVLRVSPVLKAKMLNAVANAVVQSATTTKTPLLDAGLDGTGEVIQVRRLRRERCARRKPVRYNCTCPKSF